MGLLSILWNVGLVFFLNHLQHNLWGAGDARDNQCKTKSPVAVVTLSLVKKCAQESFVLIKVCIVALCCFSASFSKEERPHLWSRFVNTSFCWPSATQLSPSSAAWLEQRMEERWREAVMLERQLQAKPCWGHRHQPRQAGWSRAPKKPWGELTPSYAWHERNINRKHKATGNSTTEVSLFIEALFLLALSLCLMSVKSVCFLTLLRPRVGKM